MRGLQVLVFLVCALSSTTKAQTTARAQTSGTVASVKAANHQFSLKTDQGATVTVTTSDRTLILHLPPGVTDPQKGSKMTVDELAQGDRVVAIYRGTPGDASVEATSVVVRTHADLGEIATSELADWRKRGTVGIVTAIDPAAKTLTIKSGAKTLTVNASDQTQYHRYSLDSAKPADAKASTLAAIQVGDQVHVLGNKNAEGTTTTAEQIYAGAFRQLAATIEAIDPATGEMKVKDLATKKPLTIRVDSDTTMKKLDPQMAAVLARRYGAGRGTEADAGGRGGRGGGDTAQTIDRLPAIPITVLKPGDAVMVSTTVGSDPNRVTAIMLLAGVEPLLTASPNSTRDIMSGWNLGGGEGGEGNQ